MSCPDSVRIDSGWNCTPSIGKLTVPQRHHQPVLRLRRHLEHVGHGVAVDDKRVVTGRGERARQAGQHANPRVSDLRRLAVHHLRGAHHFAAVHLSDALMAEAHPEHGDAPLAECADRFVRHAGILGSAGPRRHENGIGFECDQLVEGDGVVSVDHGLRAELTEVLHEVVDERVVVVDDEHPCAHHGNLAVAPAVATGDSPTVRGVCRSRSNARRLLHHRLRRGTHRPSRRRRSTPRCGCLPRCLPACSPASP